mgnify:CR=1 FL=1|jgi:hypothetical protein|tara:strand:- start:253 stop:540 length:288 start_codon:yes stop_codon:yes gene_type:complete
MSDTLNKKEIDQLMKLFDAIKLDLQDTSFPTRTNRLEAVENMAKVLEIHGWKAIRDPEISIEPSKSQEEEIKMPFPDARDQHLINKNLSKATGGK